MPVDLDGSNPAVPLALNLGFITVFRNRKASSLSASMRIDSTIIDSRADSSIMILSIVNLLVNVNPDGSAGFAGFERPKVFRSGLNGLETENFSPSSGALLERGAPQVKCSNFRFIRVRQLAKQSPANWECDRIELITFTMRDGAFGTYLNTGAAFNTFVDMNRHRFAVFQFIDFRRAGVCTLTVPFAFVIVHLNGDRIALPCFNIHRFTSFQRG